MSQVLQDSTIFFLAAVLAIFAQNAIFSRALGVSRLVQLVGDDEVSSYIFGGMLCLLQILIAPLSYWANLLLVQLSARSLVRPLVYVACVSVVCIVLYYLFLQGAKKWRFFRRLVQVLPIAAFNSAVLGTLLITTKQDYTLIQSVGFGFGSGIGYLMAVMLITEAQRKLQHPSVPKAFQGLPITLLYIGVLALAIYAFTGHTVTI